MSGEADSEFNVSCLGNGDLGQHLAKKFKNSEKLGFMGNAPLDSFKFLFDTW